MIRTAPVLRTVAAGVTMIAVTFGLARYGYGLLLPDLQAGLAVNASGLPQARPPPA
jgi:hypothetical protein